MSIVLVGPKASGKTTVGRKVARELRLPFEDTDGIIETIHAERTGERRRTRAIFREKGQAYFREIEEEAVEWALREGERVVSLGGGAPMRDDIDELLAGSLVVYLDTADDILWNRITRRGVPAFLDRKDPKADFQRMLGERRPVYEQIAQLQIDASDRSENISRRIVSHWKKFSL